jgi:hypothetical protein
MFENRVLFHIGAEPWTLVAVCTVLGLTLFVIGGSLMALLLVRYGETRRLEGREASRVAFNADRIGELRPIHGPAIGVERRMSFTIGDLRRARAAGDNLVFWGVPAWMTTLSAGIGFLCLAGAVLIRTPALFFACLIALVPMFLIACFMPWAAVYTQLE